jgi:hypothetical protein
MPRRLALVALAAVLLVAAVGACGGRSGDGDVGRQRAAQARRLARDAGLDVDVQRFLATAAGVVGRRFRVTYALSGEAGGTSEVFQDPPRRRVDVVRDDPATPEVREVSTGPRSFRCARSADGWACQDGGSPELPGAFAGGDLQATVDALRAAKVDYTFRVTARRILDVDADCLVTELRPGRPVEEGGGRKGTLCNSAAGVPLLVETPTRSIRALRYSTKVPADAFEAPAPVR